MEGFPFDHEFPSCELVDKRGPGQYINVEILEYLEPGLYAWAAIVQKEACYAIYLIDFAIRSSYRWRKNWFDELLPDTTVKVPID